MAREMHSAGRLCSTHTPGRCGVYTRNIMRCLLLTIASANGFAVPENVFSPSEIAVISDEVGCSIIVDISVAIRVPEIRTVGLFKDEYRIGFPVRGKHSAGDVLAIMGIDGLRFD